MPMRWTKRERAFILPLLAVVVALPPIEARAYTLHDLREERFGQILGEYGPGGNCQAGPSVTIDEAGMTFRIRGREEHTGSFEFAESFFGPDYNGISFAFFPFPASEYEPGHVLMYANADEIRGKLSFEDNLGPGESLTPLEDSLIKASPLMRCNSPSK